NAEQKLAEVTATLGPRHPAAIGLAERLRRVRTAMHNEVARVAASLENDLRIARMKEGDLNGRITLLRNEIAEMNGREITLRALEREAQADQLVLKNFISRFKEMSQESDVSSQRADAQIVSYAQLPTKPDRPKRAMLILIAGMASLLAGAVAAHLA